jgi:hypothetical protein
MRSDWVPLSASALVIGAMSLVLGALLNPADPGASSSDMLQVVNDDSARWMAMSVMFLLASLSLTLGLPAVLTLFTRRGRKTGITALAVFSIGTIGTCGYALLLVFFRALVAAEALRGTALDQVTREAGLTVFLQGWVICFYGGVALLAVALFLARATPGWVPALLAVFVVMLPVVPHLGRVGGAVQILCLAVAFTGVAMAAVVGQESRSLTRQAAF